MDINARIKKRRHARHFARYRQIAATLVKYKLGDLIRFLSLESFLPFHLVPPNIPWQKIVYTRSQRTRMALEELGTTFVKVGQILSTRSDILPSDYVQELSKLQNSLLPIPLEVIEKVINEETNLSGKEIFSFFDPKPLGVASIGQVHAAKLMDGTEVVVKVQKPGVKELVAGDIEILRDLADKAGEHLEDDAQYDYASLVEEISDTLKGELDYIREGHSAEHFARFFKNDPSVHIPKVFWEYTTPHIITLERIRGISISDAIALDAAKFDRKKLAKQVVDIWVRMVFENDVFQADPHPGNIFIETNSKVGLVDFGMIGLVDDEIRGNLVSAVKSVIDRDVDLLVDSLVDLGAVTPVNSREKLRKDLKHIMEHYPALTDELQLSSNFDELFGVIRSNQVRLPANTFLLLKTMAMAQSLGKSLDINFDFFDLLVPRVTEIMQEKYKPSTIIKQIPSAVAEMALFGIGLPRSLARLTKSISRGEFQLRADVSGVERHLEHLEHLGKVIIIGLIVATTILAIAIAFLAFNIANLAR